MVADGGLRRARQPALADDGRDVRLGDPRALARQAARRLRRRLVRRAAGRRCAEGAGRRARGDRRSRRRSRSQPGTPRRSAAPRAPTSQREHDLDARRGPLRRGARGGRRRRRGRRRGALCGSREAAAEVGLDETGELGRARSRESGIVAARAVAAPARARSRSPPWAWLAGDRRRLRRASASSLARRMVAPWIMVDELIYSELAKSFAAHGHFLVRGVPTPATGSSTRY